MSAHLRTAWSTLIAVSNSRRDATGTETYCRLVDQLELHIGSSSTPDIITPCLQEVAALCRPTYLIFSALPQPKSR
jgi:hypothetical protein